MDLAFFTANVPKVLDGGWFPLLLALIVFTMLITWQRGRGLIDARRATAEGLLRDFVEEIRELTRPSTARRAPPCSSPLARRPRRSRCERTSTTTTSCIESVVIVSVVTHRVPHVHRSERVVVDELGYEDDGIAHVTVNYGFQDS